MRLSMIFLTAVVTVSAAAAPARIPNDHESDLLYRVVAGWEWNWYWTDQQPVEPRFKPGMRDEVYLVEQADLLRLCSKEMGEVWFFGTAEGRLRELAASRLAGTGSFQEQCGAAQFPFSRISTPTAAEMRPVHSKIRSILNSGRSPVIRQSPKEKQDAAANTSEWNLLAVQWPSVQVPNARQLDQPGGTELIQSIRERMDDAAGARCKPTAEVPKYGKYTPSVFVLFVEADCARYIMEFVRNGNGEWNTAAKYTSESFLGTYIPKLRAIHWRTIE